MPDTLFYKPTRVPTDIKDQCKDNANVSVTLTADKEYTLEINQGTGPIHVAEGKAIDLTADHPLGYSILERGAELQTLQVKVSTDALWVWAPDGVGTTLTVIESF